MPRHTIHVSLAWNSLADAPFDDGFWYTLPHELGWEGARKAGTELRMVALRKDDAVLALFQGSEPPGQVFSIGLAMPWEEIEEVKSRLPANAQVILDQSAQFHFRDQFGVSWQFVPPGTGFETNGDNSGR